MSMFEELRARTEPLTVKQVANLLGVAASTVQRWVRNGELPAIRVADTIRFDPVALAARLACLSMSVGETKEATVMASANSSGIHDAAERLNKFHR